MCSNREAWKRPARRHSRNGTWTQRHTYDFCLTSGWTWNLRKINQEGSFSDRSVSFSHYSSIKTNLTISSYLVVGTFRELNEVCSEVPEDSRVLRVRRLWFPTSSRLQTWLIPSGMAWSRQCHEPTIVWRNLPPYDRFWYFVLSFFSKRAWQSGSKHYQRWYEGKLHQTMVDSWYCLDGIVPEAMSQVCFVNLKTMQILFWPFSRIVARFDHGEHASLVSQRQHCTH